MFNKLLDTSTGYALKAGATSFEASEELIIMNDDF